MHILVFLAALGSLFGWISLAQIMAFNSFLCVFGVIVIFVLEVIAIASIWISKNKNG